MAARRLGLHQVPTLQTGLARVTTLPTWCGKSRHRQAVCETSLIPIAGIAPLPMAAAPLGAVSAGSAKLQGAAILKKYVADVNAAGLCGATTGWRLPSFVELQGIMDFGAISPAIDLIYFPFTATNTYWWTSNINANTGADAWAVNSTTGGSFRFPVSTSAYRVRLVRSAP